MQKLQKLFYAFLMAAIVVSFSACDDDDDDNGGTNGGSTNILDYDTPQNNDEFVYTEATKGSTNFIRVVGTINRDFTFDSRFNWLLSGAVFVADGATITIEAGTTVYGDADGSAAGLLSVLRGGRINAAGTAAEPIVFTSSNEPAGTAESGDWGGLVLNGRGQINVGDDAEGEGGTGPYGGDNDADNSGTVRYVRLEYAGRVIGTDNELNGFSFNGVGSQTTLEFLQSWNGEDDGIEFFGGAANLKWAVSSASRDDSFDWTHGWRGNGQFWVVEQAASRGDRGLEADNLEANFGATPFSEPTVSNITFIGTDGNENATIGMRLRHGTKGYIYNAIVTGFGIAVRVDDGEDLTDNHMASMELVVKNSVVNATSTTVWRDAAMFENDATNQGTVPSLTGIVGVQTAGALDPTTLGSFFSAGNFIGAIDPANDWTTGWVRNLDGTIR